ncbi:MAG: twin-arginine translocase subunit TatC [Elusimicrobia bacterium]|nr:twin-arginine translocase subunit TatC [Elusimicrobiota bacterium]
MADAAPAPADAHASPEGVRGARPPASTAPSPALARIEDPPVPLTEHLAELRRRLIVSLVSIAAGTAVLFHWSGGLLELVAKPAGRLYFTGPTDAFMTRVKLSLFGGLILALPVVLFQVWGFVARALDQSWRGPLRLMAAASYFLFLGGVGLAYFVVLPAAMRFLLACGSQSVQPLMAVDSYVGFAAALCIAFGAVFQLPLALIVLNKAGIVSREFLKSKRSYAYVLAFLVAAFLTPGPDVFSQVALAIPTLILYEITLLVLD